MRGEGRERRRGPEERKETTLRDDGQARQERQRAGLTTNRTNQNSDHMNEGQDVTFTSNTIAALTMGIPSAFLRAAATMLSLRVLLGTLASLLRLCSTAVPAPLGGAFLTLLAVCCSLFVTLLAVCCSLHTQTSSSEVCAQRALVVALLWAPSKLALCIVTVRGLGILQQ